MSCIARAGWFSSMLSAVKLCQSSSISGPVFTAKPRSAKISASSSITWLTGWMLPLGRAGAGSVRSSVSVASLRSSSAASSPALRASTAPAIAARADWIAGACACRSSGVILPSVFNNWLTQPCLPTASTRNASSTVASGAAAMAATACSVRVVRSSISASRYRMWGAKAKGGPSWTAPLFNVSDNTGYAGSAALA